MGPDSAEHPLKPWYKTQNQAKRFNKLDNRSCFGTHAGVEMPFFNQDIFDLAETMNPDPNFVDSRFTSPEFPKGMSYNEALTLDHKAGVHGIDAPLSQFNLDAVVTATDNPAWATDLLYGDHFIYGTSGLAAGPGYPIVVPAGIVFGAPLGISFFGTAFSEPTLIKLASGFEAATQVRAHNLPTFARTVPSDHISGTTLHPPSSVPAEDHRQSPLATPPPAARDQQQEETRRPHHL